TEQYLTSVCRWQQYQSLSFALPELSANEECEMNGVRPADQVIERKDGTRHVSIAVSERFKKGRELRDKLYWEILKETDLLKSQFTTDLESLAGKTEAGSTEEKIALIHLDGNKFGKIREDNCLTIEDYKDFNDVIQKEIHGVSLERLLRFATKPENKGFRTKNKEKQIKLETLMWGGDEIEWIVPASQLWDTLQIFFDVASNKLYKEIPLTYSAGVVICRHTVPILQIRHYAEQLCSIAKAASKDSPSNQFALLNMASFDAIHKNVGTFLKAYHHPATENDFIVPFSSMTELRKNVRTIRKYFPKNKLYEIAGVLAAKTGNEKIVAELQTEKKIKIQQIVDRALKMISNPWKEPTQKAIEATTALNPNKWFLISDLWSLVDDTAHEPAI
ncbi:MAG TPA: hypothetical protein VN631_14895, partial [Negativicutes bacterium]|nr:hypothetical protein [Negativicutes bacterium]